MKERLLSLNDTMLTIMSQLLPQILNGCRGYICVFFCVCIYIDLYTFMFVFVYILIYTHKISFTLQDVEMWNYCERGIWSRCVFSQFDIAVCFRTAKTHLISLCVFAIWYRCVDLISLCVFAIRFDIAVCVCMCLCVCMRACMCVNLCARVHMCVCFDVSVCMFVFVHILIYIHNISFTL